MPNPGEPAPTVVLVDDSREVRALIRRLLVTAGFDVVAEGGDGDEAIIQAYRHEPDLLLLDTSMPKADGIEALPAILALSPMTRVVMFTGFEEPGLGVRARELGAADFIEKSLPLEDLPGRLMRVLNEPVPESVPEASSQALESGARETAEPEVDDARTHDAAQDDPGQVALTAHVQQFRDLFDRAEIGMATLTSSGTIVRANRALAGLMSCTPRELVGVDYGRLTLGQGDELDSRLEDLIALSMDSTSFEHRLPAPEGDEPSRVARVTLAPIRDAQGQPLYVFAQVQDVTTQRAVESDLRRTEESFRRLVNAVGEYAIFMLDVGGSVTTWNYGAQRIKGYHAAEIVGRHFRVFYPPEAQAAGHPEHVLDKALRDGSYAEEGWRVRRDGSRFWASVVITAVYDDAGEHVGFAKVTRDQTQQREHEEERQRFIDERTHLLAVTAHELRSPIAVIDGSALALHNSPAGPSTGGRDELLGGIRKGLTRLRRLAADLSDAARSDAEALPMQIREVSLTEALRGAVERGEAAGSGIHIDADPVREEVFHADAERLAQALDNLVDNAVRHGGPPFRLSSIVDDVVSIRVIDGGPGVPPELEPHLFDRFAKTGDSGGTGLGLSLVREIARQHGGDAIYHPPAGPPLDQATAFEIRFPRRP